MFYKNVINGEVVGLTESPYALNVENFYEITKEEYIALGGYIADHSESLQTFEMKEETPSGLTNALIEALIE